MAIENIKNIDKNGEKWGYQYSINCASSAGVVFTPDVDWIIKEQNPEDGTVIFTVDSNPKYAERIGTIQTKINDKFICDGSAEKNYNVTVTQGPKTCECNKFVPEDGYGDVSIGSGGSESCVITKFPINSDSFCFSNIGVTNIDYQVGEGWLDEPDSQDWIVHENGEVTCPVQDNMSGNDRFAMIMFSATTPDGRTCTTETTFTQYATDCNCKTLTLDPDETCLIWEYNEFSNNSKVELTIKSGDCHSIQSVTLFNVTENDFDLNVQGDKITIKPHAQNNSDRPIIGEIRIKYTSNGQQCSDKIIKINQYSNKQYLRFDPLSTCKFSACTENTNRTYYSKDGGATWHCLNGGVIEVTPCECVLWKAEGDTYKGTPGSTYVEPQSGFFSTGSFRIRGNIMSMIYGDDFEGKTELRGDATFDSIFAGCSVIDASGLILPATNLKEKCYRHMFSDCARLKYTPSLKKEAILAKQCYDGMFGFCPNLEQVPNFNSSLTLASTEMAEMCFRGMFTNCELISELPNGYLPSTNLARSCYNSMFSGCKSLRAIPSGFLPAQNLAISCYYGMFSYCKSLETVPIKLLNSNNLAKDCYAFMFEGCTSLTIGPDLTSTTLVEGCYIFMFESCTSLTSLKATFTTNLEPDNHYPYTARWLRNVASNGTLTVNRNAEWSTYARGESTVPENWDITEV